MSPFVIMCLYRIILWNIKELEELQGRWVSRTSTYLGKLSCTRTIQIFLVKVNVVAKHIYAKETKMANEMKDLKRFNFTMSSSPEYLQRFFCGAPCWMQQLCTGMTQYGTFLQVLDWMVQQSPADQPAWNKKPLSEHRYPADKKHANSKRSWRERSARENEEQRLHT